jgi:hypothetical protein
MLAWHIWHTAIVSRLLAPAAYLRSDFELAVSQLRPPLDALGIFALFVELGFTIGAATYQAAMSLGLLFYDVCSKNDERNVHSDDYSIGIY